MVSTPLAPFLLTLPGTTFSDRVYWTGGEKYGSNGGGNLWSWKFVSYMYVPSKLGEVEGGRLEKEEKGEGREEEGE